MSAEPCPSIDPLTDAPCVLRDDRLDHGGVGHVAESTEGLRVWSATERDALRWGLADYEERRAATAEALAEKYAVRRAAEAARARETAA